MATAPPTPPTLLTIDHAAVDDAVTRLRLAAEALDTERLRHDRAVLSASVTWIGDQRTRLERDVKKLAGESVELATALRKAATDLRFAEDAAVRENRARQAAYEVALAAYQQAVLVAPRA